MTCPYNASHQITEGRIQFHLVKCRKANPAHDLVVCPYNTSHHVPRPEEAYHISVCADRKIVEAARYKWASEPEKTNGATVRRDLEAMRSRTEPPRVSDHLGEEDWEKEATVAISYDPSKKCKETTVLRKLQGATPSQRKEFREKEKIRHEMLKEDEARKVLQPGSNLGKRESFLQPLRRPSFASNPVEGGGHLLAAHLGRGKGMAAPETQLRRPGSLGGGLRRPGSLITDGAAAQRDPANRLSMSNSLTMHDINRGRGRPLLSETITA